TSFHGHPGEVVPGIRGDGEGRREVLVEVAVGGQDQGQRSGGGFRRVVARHVRDQTFTGLGGAHDRDAQRLVVHRRRAVLDKIVNGADLRVGHGLVGERVRGTGGPEQQVLGFFVEDQRVAHHSPAGGVRRAGDGPR